MNVLPGVAGDESSLELTNMRPGEIKRKAAGENIDAPALLGEARDVFYRRVCMKSTPVPCSVSSKVRMEPYGAKAGCGIPSGGWRCFASTIELFGYMSYAHFGASDDMRSWRLDEVEGREGTDHWHARAGFDGFVAECSQNPRCGRLKPAEKRHLLINPLYVRSDPVVVKG